MQRPPERVYLLATGERRMDLRTAITADFGLKAKIYAIRKGRPRLFRGPPFDPVVMFWTATQFIEDVCLCCQRRFF